MSWKWIKSKMRTWAKNGTMLLNRGVVAAMFCQPNLMTLSALFHMVSTDESGKWCNSGLLLQDLG